MPIEIRANRLSLNQLLNFIGNRLANKFRKVWTFEEGTVAIFVRDKYMLRNGQTLTVIITVELRSDWRDLVITIASSGGRQGWLRLDVLGAENAAERWAEKEIKRALTTIDGSGRTTYQTPSERPIE